MVLITYNVPMEMALLTDTHMVRTDCNRHLLISNSLAKELEKAARFLCLHNERMESVVTLETTQGDDYLLMLHIPLDF